MKQPSRAFTAPRLASPARGWMGHRDRQRGMGLISLLLLGAVLLAVVMVGMQVAPAFLEYHAAKKAIEKIAGSGETSVFGVTKSFDQIAAIEDITSITGKDLRVLRTGNGVVIRLAYERRIHLVSNASLLLEFEADAKSP